MKDISLQIQKSPRTLNRIYVKAANQGTSVRLMEIKRKKVLKLAREKWYITYREQCFKMFTRNISHLESREQVIKALKGNS